MGFVQLSDELPSWEWFDDKNTVYVYIRLLLGASWGERDYRGVRLQRGQLMISQREFAEKCGISRQELRTILDRLTATRKITRTSTNKFSIITLVEYDCAARTKTRAAPVKQPAVNPPSLSETNRQNIKPPNTALAREGGVFDNADFSVKTNEGFERFWAAYPKKTAKQQAFKAFQGLKPDEALLTTILSSLERHKRSVQWTKDGGQYIPYPATWLNGRRWEDELQEVNKNGKSCTDIEHRSREDWLRGFEN